MGRSRDRHNPSLFLVACAVWLAASCAPSTSVGPRGQEPSAARGPTTLQLGSSSEKTGGILYQGYVQPDTNLVFHTSLTLYDERGDLVPRLAQKVPTVGDGDWKVNPDGTMEVTWRFRPDVR